MEGAFLNEAPKFKTPEEELDYLRAHVARREQELKDSGQHEGANENAVKDILGEYKQKSSEEVLHKDNILKQSEAEAIVLQLKPEMHDTIMEELLGVVVTKGIRNAFSIVEKMNDPHVDDDFHRILIQYLKTGMAFDLKEGTPLYKSLHMTLFEITLPPPREEGDKERGFKEFIGAMEQFYAGMNSISEGKNNEKESEGS